MKINNLLALDFARNPLKIPHINYVKKIKDVWHRSLRRILRSNILLYCRKCLMTPSPAMKRRMRFINNHKCSRACVAQFIIRPQFAIDYDFFPINRF